MWRVELSAGFLRGDQAEANLLVGHGVIARNLHGLAVADQVAARIAHVGHGHAIEPQGAGDHRRGHARRSAAAGVGRFQNVHVCLLDQAGQQRAVGFSILGFRKSRDHAFHCGLGGYFALLVPADSVRQNEQPAMRARPRRSFRRHMAVTIFVVVANSSDIGSLGKFEFQHRKLRLPRSRAGWRDAGTKTVLDLPLAHG